MVGLFGYVAAQNKKERAKIDVKIQSPTKFVQLSTELPAELIATLLKMAPTQDEEVLQLKLYNGDINQLGPSQRFLKNLVEISHAFKRLEALQFLSSVHADYNMVKESFATLEVACNKLIRNKLFLRLLKAVLKTGNRMNDGLEPNEETPEYLQQLGVGVVSKLSEELNDVKKATLADNELLISSETMVGLFGYVAAQNKKERAKIDVKIQSPTKFVQLSEVKNISEFSDSSKSIERTELPAELIATLLKMASTQDEEVLQLKLYNGDINQLGPSQRFLKNLVEISHAFKRLEALQFLSSVHEDYNMVKESFATLEVACNKLIRNKLFLRLLKAVLKTGNRMNDGLEPNEETPEYLQQLGVGVVSKLSEELNDVKKATLADNELLISSVTDEQMNDHMTNLLTPFVRDEHMNDLDANGSSSDVSSQHLETLRWTHVPGKNQECQEFGLSDANWPQHYTTEQNRKPGTKDFILYPIIRFFLYLRDMRRLSKDL
ncbi:formin, FH2 domain-containing protein [Artemisia annua]|uniref:Formin-like protein n=1 Tax=Artemisia annua TaxID=35608 RepID=A0A2U1Q825_ARTAN|nr:formin, FH2 domain-containing protein [Artemisia annua]